MQSRRTRLWPVLFLLALLVMLRVPTAHAQAADATGLTFAVRLQLPPQAAGGPSADTCESDQRARLGQLTLQFHLTTNGPSPMVSIAPSNLSAPEAAAGDTVPLQADASGLSFTGAHMHLSIDQITLDDGRMHLTSSRSGAAPDGLMLDHLTVSAQAIPGDVVFFCSVDATGSGVLDTTPPVAFFADRCSAAAATAGCVLLADGAVTVAFSKPVVLADVPNVLTVSDDQGNAVPLFPTMPADPIGYALSIHGAWPLGRTLTFRLAAGVHDVAANAYNVGTPPLLHTLTVVADPGDLDATGNSGFETGDLSGYTANSQPNRENLSAVYDVSAYAFTPAAPPVVASDFDGIEPSEGNGMLTAGSLTGDCGDDGIVVLTARFNVPQGVAALVFDDAAMAGGNPATYPVQGPILTASVRGAGAITAATQYWKDLNGLSTTDDGSVQTGWRQVSADVSGFAGQTVVLTLRLFTQTLEGPLLPCHTSVILVDNLRFA